MPTNLPAKSTGGFSSNPDREVCKTVVRRIVIEPNIKCLRKFDIALRYPKTWEFVIVCRNDYAKNKPEQIN